MSWFIDIISSWQLIVSPLQKHGIHRLLRNIKPVMCLLSRTVSQTNLLLFNRCRQETKLQTYRENKLADSMLCFLLKHSYPSHTFSHSDRTKYRHQWCLPSALVLGSPSFNPQVSGLSIGLHQTDYKLWALSIDLSAINKTITFFNFFHCKIFFSRLSNRWIIHRLKLFLKGH